MIAFNAYLLFVVLVVLATAAPAPGNHHVRFRTHLKQTLSFPCHKPQPRAMLASDLVTMGTSERIDPPYTVLHRCDGGAGCCDSHNRRCKHSHSENVTLVFLVTDSLRGGSYFREVQQTNHTRCHCVSTEVQPPK